MDALSPDMFVFPDPLSGSEDLNQLLEMIESSRAALARTAALINHSESMLAQSSELLEALHQRSRPA